VINVRSHGAVGDGVTDDLPAFNAAKAAARAAGNYYISVPLGNYYLSASYMIDCSGGIPVFLIGEPGANLTTDKDIALVTIDTSAGRIDGLQLRDLTFIQTGIRSVTDGLTNFGSPVVASVMANFTSQDVGREITGGGIPDNTYIGQVNSPTQIQLSSSDSSNVPVNATATCRSVTDGRTFSDNPQVTSATANFVSQDIGLPITGDGIPANTYIGVVTDPHTIQLRSPDLFVPVNATKTASGVALSFGRDLSISNAHGTGLLLTEATPTGNPFNDCHFLNLHFYGQTYCVRNTRSIAQAEANMNACVFNGISAWNAGLKYPKYIFKFDYGGGGTGNMYLNTTGLASVFCFSFGGTGGVQNVGDIIIMGFHLFGSRPAAGGFEFIGGTNAVSQPNYNNQVQIMGGQVDNNSISLKAANMNEFEFYANWGGGNQAFLTTCARFTLNRDFSLNAHQAPCVVMTACTSYTLIGRNGLITLGDQLLAPAVTLNRANRTIDFSQVIGNAVFVGPTVGAYFNNNLSTLNNLFILDDGTIGMPRIPTSDPHVFGRIWRNGTALMFSTG
jgi:hypothetical protein